MGATGLGFDSEGEAHIAAEKLRKLFKCHTRVVSRGNGYWAVRIAYNKDLLR